MQGYFLDTNVWMAASFPDHPSYLTAQAFLSERNHKEPAWLSAHICISWLRLLSSKSTSLIYGSPPLTNNEAQKVLQKWINQPEIQYMAIEPAGTFQLWQKLSASPFPSPKVWMDAYIAAIAIKANLPLVTFDKGFQVYTSAGLELVEI